MPKKNQYFSKKKANPKSTGKSFAMQHWEEFETLSIHIIKNIYEGIPESVCKLTSSRSDGGYDGFICFPISPHDASALYKILLEAKLRSTSKHDLPLSDFSKTIIVAVNTIADKVYIVTNAYFSAETKRRLTIYSQRTGLEIQTIDINYISGWIKDHRVEAEGICSSTFLDALASMDLHISESPAQPVQQLVTQLFEPTEKTELIGQSRKKLLRALTETLSHNNGVLGITAIPGAGKTVFTEKLVWELQPNYKKIAWIDLSCFSGIREVFLHMLSIAWGVEPSEIYGMSDEDLREVTEYLGDHQFPSKSRKTLIHMIHQSSEQFDQNQTIHTELLLDYLRTIIPPTLRRVRCLVVISSLDRATSKALDFLCSVIRILSGSPISFLLKIDDRVDSTRQAKVTRFLSDVKRERSYLDTVLLPEWGVTEARQFLDINARWLTSEDKAKLISYFGAHPLALSAGSEAIRNSELGRVIEHSSIGLPSLSARFKLSLGCVDHIVTEFAAIGGTSVHCGLVVLGLFDGHAATSLIDEVAVACSLSSPVPALSVCPFLRKDVGQFHVRHDVYLNSIQKYEFVTRSFFNQILVEIEPILEKHFSDPEYIMRKRFTILHKTKDYEKLHSIWLPLAISHLSHGEHERVYDVLKAVYELWMENIDIYHLNLYEQHWLLYHLIEAFLKLEGSEAPELQYYIEQLDAVMQLASASEWPTDGLSFKHAMAKAASIKCQVALGQADYRNMLVYADRGIAQMGGTLDSQELECLAELWNNKALAIKHLENLQASVAFLETGKERLGNARHFKHALYSNTASLYTMSDPETALDYFKKTKEECGDSLSDTLHVDHNIATMYFLLGQYDKAEELCGRVWTISYENNIAIEEGRSDHLLGSIAWVRGDLEVASEHFLAAYKLFQIHVHRTHIWPPLINLSSLCMEMGHEPEALVYTKEAVDFLLRYHLDNINNIDMSSDSLPKIYVGVLIILDHCERLGVDKSLKNRLLEEITLPDLRLAYSAYIIPDRLDELLKGTKYLCEGKRILKI